MTRSTNTFFLSLVPSRPLVPARRARWRKLTFLVLVAVPSALYILSSLSDPQPGHQYRLRFGPLLRLGVQDVPGDQDLPGDPLEVEAWTRRLEVSGNLK